MKPEETIDKVGIVVKKSLVKEVKQRLERKSWHGVHPSNIPVEERKRIIPRKMFVKKKFTASGAFDKVKSRLVAEGHRLDARLYKDKTSAPQLFSIATFAHVEGRAVRQLWMYLVHI